MKLALIVTGVVLNLMFAGYGIFSPQRPDASAANISSAQASPLAPYFKMFIKVDSGLSEPGPHAVGSIISKLELINFYKLGLQISNEEIFKRTGFIVAEGQAVDQRWPIAKTEMLKAWGNKLPALQGRFYRLN